VEIRRHEFVVGGDGQLGPASARGVGAGGVDEGIDLAEPREHRGGQRRNGRLIADIAGEGGETFAGRGGGEREGGGEGFGPATDEGDAPALGGKLEDDGATHAAAGTGDEGDRGKERERFLWHGSGRMMRGGRVSVAGRIQRRVRAAGEKQGAELGRLLVFGVTVLHWPKIKCGAAWNQ
jgi:hypothetical protein